MIMSFSRTPGCTWRATTHNRVPPPNQSIEASPSPTTIHPQWRCKQRPRDRLDVLAIHGEHDDDTGQRDDGEEFEAATEQAWRESEAMWWRN